MVGLEGWRRMGGNPWNFNSLKFLRMIFCHCVAYVCFVFSSFRMVLPCFRWVSERIMQNTQGRNRVNHQRESSRQKRGEGRLVQKGMALSHEAVQMPMAMERKCYALRALSFGSFGWY